MSVVDGAIDSESVKEQFVTLVRTQFIRRCLAVEPNTTDDPQPIPSFSTEEQDVYSVPTSVLTGRGVMLLLTTTADFAE